MLDFDKIHPKLEILSAAARYDASCASSGSRRNRGQTPGNGQPAGVCHSWSADGRCISLLKLLLSNACRYDCAYCVNRRSSNVPRATFTPREVAELTVNFYRRNYIEGLFLSTGVFTSADETMEQMVATAHLLREEYAFRGYLHLKLIPGASPLLVEQAGRLADRVSVNIELPTEQSLCRLAPDKSRLAILAPMRQSSDLIAAGHEERRKSRKAPLFAPGGQSTQLIVGASPESDREILSLASALYARLRMKRVYYSAYAPVACDPRLPPLDSPPLLREHRLYQADWLLRYYGFRVDELLDEGAPQLDLRLDPKAAWALRHAELFPVEVERADLDMLLRVPGIGVRSARRIVVARRYGRLDPEALRRLGVVLKRARGFITIRGRLPGAAIPQGAGGPPWLAAGREPAEVGTGRQLPLFAADRSGVTGEF